MILLAIGIWVVGFIGLLCFYAWSDGSLCGYGWERGEMICAYDEWWIASLVWPVTLIGLLITLCIYPIMDFLDRQGYEHAKRKSK